MAWSQVMRETSMETQLAGLGLQLLLTGRNGRSCRMAPTLESCGHFQTEDGEYCSFCIVRDGSLCPMLLGTK